jgi:hypothetical protein
MRRLVLLLACVAAAACPAPADVTPEIHVDPRAAQRVNLLAAPAAAPAEGKSRQARVHWMKDGEQLGGPNAIGRPGDLVLENDEVVFVIDQLGSGTGFAESGGNIADAADARIRKDELGQMFTFFGAFPRQGVYETLTSGIAGDGSAWVEAKGRELHESKLTVTTRYTLRPSDRALLIETALENQGNVVVELASVGDAIEWGGAEKVAPGRHRGFSGASSGPYIGGVGRYTSYAVTSTEGAIDGTSGGFWTNTAQRKAVRVAPGGKTSYARIFVVGERPDTSSLVGELAMAAGQAVGDLHVRPSRASSLPTGVLITLLVDASKEELTLAPPFVARLPVGRYWAAPIPRLANAATWLGPIDVKSEGESEVDVPVEVPATLEVSCTERNRTVKPSASAIHTVPCKITLQGLDATFDPDFGPANASGPARNQATTADGTTRVTLVPGKYRVTASRGPEYSIAAVDVELGPGARDSEKLEIARVVDTRGYLACDFHQHTMFSADAPVATRDRMVANVAEGVEIAVATDHNVVANLEPIVKELQLERELVSIPGDELTTDASAHPWGHANVFPMPFDAQKPRGGAPAVRDRGAREVFESLRAQSPGDLVVQVNHPRSGRNGYFDLLGFDPARGIGTDPTYEAAFDAVEVWNGHNVDTRAKVMDDWRSLLRNGHEVTPTANTDTHGIVGQEAGYPRTYVRVADDGHLDSWDAARTADLVHGVKGLRDVVLTNGPMLRVSANGAPIGGFARGHTVTLKVHVECAPWVDVDTVRVMRVSDKAPSREDQKSVKLVPLPSGARGVDVTFVQRSDLDDALFVVASGSKPLTPVLAGDEHEILPWAMTGAIWVDADGDGRVLGRARP